MKRLYKNFIFLSLSLLVCMFLAIPANAQHRGGGGNHGGGNHGGGNHGGGGGHSNGGGGGGRSNGGGGGGRSFNGGGRSFSGSRATVSGRNFSSSRPSFNGAHGNFGGRRSFAAPGARGRVGVGVRRGGIGGRAFVGGRGYGRGFSGRGFARRGYYARGFYSHGFYHRPYLGFGYRGGFGRGGFYFHSGFYNRFYWPRLGFSVGFLPYGYYPFYWGGLQYYYSNGYYYNYDNNQYTVVEPPVGAQIGKLPAGAQSIMINGQQYYELDGIYYVAVTKDDGSLAYEIAGKDGELNTDNGSDDQYNDQQAPAGDDQGYDNAPDQQQDQPEQPEPRKERNGSTDIQVGDIVQSLPKDSRGVTVNGKKLFVSPDDVYYKQTRDNDGNVAYKIVGLPSEAPDGDQ